MGERPREEDSEIPAIEPLAFRPAGPDRQVDAYWVDGNGNRHLIEVKRMRERESRERQIRRRQRPLSQLELRLRDLVESLALMWSKPLAPFHRDEYLPQIVIIYLESQNDDIALRRALTAIDELGGEIRSATEVIRGSIWQAVVAVFKREAKPELMDGAGEYGVAAVKNKVYGETQAFINKTNAEAIQIMQNAIGDAENGLMLLGNLLALRVNGIPYGVELTPLEARLLQSRPDLQRNPAELHTLLFQGGMAKLATEISLAVVQAPQDETD
ncbi:hypothetical protein [Nonomuraea fuscirosea]|uniref:hypothetical protein n=1 Tax=Nonomuraea fuscirosea TaxID=1291556 RepID=UPI0033D30B76